MALTLRDYQQIIVQQIRQKMQEGYKRILVVAPTGSGKTALTSYMIARASEKGMRSQFNVHRRELIMQSIRAFLNAEVIHGVVAAKFAEDYKPLAHICSVQSLARRLHKIEKPRLCVWDEAHHIAARTWSNIFNEYSDAFHIGVTATPKRTDGKGLGEWFDCIIEGPSVAWLIENGWLCPYKLYAPHTADMSGVHKRMGDFNVTEAEAVMDKPTITGNAIAEYKKLALGKRNVVFCLTVKHSQHVVAQFNQSGISAMHVDGETPSLERDRAIDLFHQGKIDVLSNVELFGEGFDLPALEVVTMLRPTYSTGLYLQQCGRVLRPSPGKDHAIILDHVGNYARHGLPDEEREWSLNDSKNDNKGKTELSPKVCEKCFAAQPPRRSHCIYCGHQFESNERQIEQVDGDLTEIDPTALRKARSREQHQAQSQEELYLIGKKRGMRHPRAWAKHVFNARRLKKLNGR